MYIKMCWVSVELTPKCRCTVTAINLYRIKILSGRRMRRSIYDYVINEAWENFKYLRGSK